MRDTDSRRSLLVYTGIAYVVQYAITLDVLYFYIVIWANKNNIRHLDCSSLDLNPSPSYL